MEGVFVLLLKYRSSGAFRPLELDYKIADILCYLIENGIKYRQLRFRTCPNYQQAGLTAGRQILVAAAGQR